MADDDNLKQRVAGTVKWNIIDRVATQALYAITGIVLARMLSQADFGLVGAILVFQAFASLFVDSGFSSALIQRKDPDALDYSTVFWFNLGMAVALYGILWPLAPLIARLFHAGPELVPLARVMFLTFILNALTIVQVNRRMKRMDVRMVAVANSAGLIAGAVAGIYGAVAGWGAWAIVAQALALGLVKGILLWATERWVPMLRFSWQRLRSFFRVGAGVMGSSLLNTIFQNVYSFFIGNRTGLVPLGYFTQADKWSKMGVMSLSQVLTSSFLPALSRVQDQPERFAAATAKMNRTASWMLFPAMGFLAVMAQPIFHALFGTKWDASIALFQLLLLRGVFTVLTALYNNYILALGRSSLLVWTEVLRDVVALAFILLTLPVIAETRPDDPVWGVRIFVAGQVVASAITWVATLWLTVPLTRRTRLSFMWDSVPYAGLTLVAMAAMWLTTLWVSNAWALIGIETVVGLAIYLGANKLLGSRVQTEALASLRP